uniref:Uncharacterized protein n=1 Tax=Sphaerodactylus townsendi TaxID=933632 RepID=A0ACB8EC01_9SAUR
MGEPPGMEAAPGSVLCRLQFLEDSDPFSCAAFPEPRRAPVQPVLEALPLAAQLPAMHRLLAAPLPWHLKPLQNGLFFIENRNQQLLDLC